MDPPWEEKGGGKSKRGADRHYPVLEKHEIVLESCRCCEGTGFRVGDSDYIEIQEDVGGSSGFQITARSVQQAIAGRAGSNPIT